MKRTNQSDKNAGTTRRKFLKTSTATASAAALGMLGLNTRVRAEKRG